MNNEIILKSVYGKVQKTYFIQPCPNPKTGKLPACVKTVNSNGDMILSEDDIIQMNTGKKHFVPANHVFTITDGTYFNLDDTVDAANWEAIQYCNWIAKDRHEKDHNGNLIIDGDAKKYGVADLYIERPGQATKYKVNKKQEIFEAQRYIFGDNEAERLKKAKVLGRSLSNAVPADVLDYLIEISEKNPKRIKDLYEGEDWKMHLFILDAIDRGVIRKADGIFKYDDKIIGGTIEAAIIFLRDIRYKKLLDSIKRETYPNLLTKNEIDEINEQVTEGIPHFEDATAKKAVKK